MRIVMLTDDQIIDRRILQEAETLIANNHEVILITPHYHNTQQHEKIGNVKIERVSMDACITFFEKTILRTQTFLINICNKVSIGSQKAIIKVWGMNQSGTNKTVTTINSLYSWCINCINKIHGTGTQYHHQIWNFLSLILNKTLMSLGNFFNKLFSLLSRGSHFLLQQTRNVLISLVTLVDKLFTQKQPSNKMKVRINTVFNWCIDHNSKLYNISTRCNQQIWGRANSLTNKLLIKLSVFFNYLFCFFIRGNNFMLRQIRRGSVYLTAKISLLVNKFIEIYSISFNKLLYWVACSINFLSTQLILFRRGVSAKQSINTKMLSSIVYFNPDIIHAHDLPQLNLAVAAKQKLNVPLIYDAHELYTEIDTLTPKQKKYYKHIEKKLTPQCNQIIIPNEFAAEEMQKRYPIRLPSVILNATNPPGGFSNLEKHDRFRKLLNISEKHKILLFQGWMSKTRGLQPLVQGMSDVEENIHLVLMGYGDVQDSLKEIAQQQNISHRIHIIDPVSQNELLFWTASADVGIIPYQAFDLNDFNSYYCSPNKLFEFIQAGLPIIANDLPFLRSVIEKQQIGQVFPLKEASDYSAAINNFFAALEEKQEDIKINLSKAASIYNWDVEGEKLLNIYAQLQ